MNVEARIFSEPTTLPYRRMSVALATDGDADTARRRPSR
jgi:formate-dependent phosphoribosylglycinamide formyltransferase (GAR transformylase)